MFVPELARFSTPLFGLLNIPASVQVRVKDFVFFKKKVLTFVVLVQAAISVMPADKIGASFEFLDKHCKNVLRRVLPSTIDLESVMGLVLYSKDVNAELAFKLINSLIELGFITADTGRPERNLRQVDILMTHLVKKGFDRAADCLFETCRPNWSVVSALLTGGKVGKTLLWHFLYFYSLGFCVYRLVWRA